MLFRSLDGAGASSDRSQTAKKRWQDLELGQSRMSNRAALDGNPSIRGPAYPERQLIHLSKDWSRCLVTILDRE